MGASTRQLNVAVIVFGIAVVAAVAAVDAAPIQGQIYVTNYATGTIGVYNLNGTPINTALITGLDGPKGIAVSGGYIYVATSDPLSNSGGSIGKYTTSGATVNANFVTFHTVFPDPVGLAISGTDLFVTNEFGDRVGHFTTTGATIDDSVINTGTGSSPYALAISGSTMFISLNGGEVSEYTTSGDLIQFGLIPFVPSASGIGVLGDRIFVESAIDGTVGCYTTSGAPVNTSLISGLHTPIGIAVTPEPTAMLVVFPLAAALLQRRR